jgi:hypothetical protein
MKMSSKALTYLGPDQRRDQNIVQQRPPITTSIILWAISENNQPSQHWNKKQVAAHRKGGNQWACRGQTNNTQEHDTAINVNTVEFKYKI